IIARMAKATLGNRSRVDWAALEADYDRIRDHISRVIPGFERFNERIRKDIFYLPNSARDRKFITKTGKANFTVHTIPQWDLAPGELLMMTIRSHDQYNTTIYGLDDRYRGIYGGRRVIFLNQEDMDDRGLKAGQLVDITSHFEAEERVVRRFQVVPYNIPRRCAAAYYPETNVLISVRSVDGRSDQPAFKSVRITLARSSSKGYNPVAQILDQERVTVIENLQKSSASLSRKTCFIEFLPRHDRPPYSRKQSSMRTCLNSSRILSAQ
ncbi:MAG TPA: molybdopterin dinucleotide binding domain-containing protein, partial [Nitrospira sp.]|nr:molybdopterin dinucleotide binding domain-containing protein [Nitrospira sp.]